MYSTADISPLRQWIDGGCHHHHQLLWGPPFSFPFKQLKPVRVLEHRTSTVQCRTGNKYSSMHNTSNVFCRNHKTNHHTQRTKGRTNSTTQHSTARQTRAPTRPTLPLFPYPVEKQDPTCAKCDKLRLSTGKLKEKEKKKKRHLGLAHNSTSNKAKHQESAPKSVNGTFDPSSPYPPGHCAT